MFCLDESCVSIQRWNNYLWTGFDIQRSKSFSIVLNFTIQVSDSLSTLYRPLRYANVRINPGYNPKILFVFSIFNLWKLILTSYLQLNAIKSLESHKLAKDDGIESWMNRKIEVYCYIDCCICYCIACIIFLNISAGFSSVKFTVTEKLPLFRGVIFIDGLFHFS